MKIAIQFNNSVGCVGLPYTLDCGLLVTSRFDVTTTREKGNVAKHYGQDCSFPLSVKSAFSVRPTLASDNSPKVSYKH